MPPAQPWTDEFTLLCERCGYVVEGLATDGACPECGKPIAESLPERRVGTAWQRKPGVVPLLRTWDQSFFHPIQTLDRLDPGAPTRGMIGWTAAVCAGLVSVGIMCPTGVFLLEFGIDTIGDAITTILPLILWLCILYGMVFGLVLLLTEVESRGLVLISRQRETRITTSIARRVCDHGSVGWVICASIVALLGLASTASYLLRDDLMPAWVYLMGLGGMAFGFLFFETFAWLGLRRLKYANRRRPEAGATG